jgi:AcrR family transcriptional regulator
LWPGEQVPLLNRGPLESQMRSMNEIRREPLNRPGTARYPKGKERVELILKSAKEIFIRKGYGGLTMRNVAAAANTTVGNLQYYYHDKERLLKDLLAYMVHGFFESFASISENPRTTAEEKLRAYLECIFDAFPIEDKGKFYPEFWALSNHDATAAKLMENMYETGMVTLKKFISEANPALSQREVKDIAITIVGSVEGLVVFVGYKRPWAKRIKAVRRYAIENCMQMVTGGRPK